ncbi:MAG TPA: hypothetical protein VFL80_07145 [Thermoanaerobaculia bacterium]|nr:hypothetical protein [Thermoanaerobaculia bacterium]
MTTQRKAEIQRRLSMKSLPKPPAGLSDRIKSDIPANLQAAMDSERRRLSTSMAFNLRVAASILLLVTSSIFVLHVFYRADSEKSAATAPDAARVQPARLNAGQSSTIASSVEAAAAAPSEIGAVSQAAASPSFNSPVASPPPSAAAPPLVADARNLQARLEPEKKETLVDEPTSVALHDSAAVAEPPPPPQVAEEDSRARRSARVGSAGSTESRTSAAEPAPAMAPSAAASVAPAEFMKSARAADLRLTNHREVFGISIDPDAFPRVKTAIEGGERPDAGSIDVEAIVNYFAGSAPPRRKELTLEVEASPAPGASQNGPWLLRYTIDTAVAGGRVSSAPLGTNARVEIRFNDSAVMVHPSEPNPAASHEAVLLPSTSVTALHPFRLKENATRRQPAATVRLTYFSLAENRQKTVEKTLFIADFRRSWMDASRRHRLATLGAQWGESLKSGAAASDLARRATELSRQKPDDSRAKELSDVAGVTGRNGS